MAKYLTLQKAQELFQQYLGLRNYSARTIFGYSRIVTKFLDHLKFLKLNFIQDLTLTHVQSFLKTRYYFINQKGQPNCPKTRNGEIKSLRVFLKFLEKKGFLKQILSAQIKLVQAPLITLPKDILTKTELLYVFSLADKGTILGYRDRTILELLYATGIRAHECVQIEIEDLLFEEQCLFVSLGKGAKDRIVPINNTALSYLKHYLFYIRPKLLNSKFKTQKLFLTYRGKPFNVSNLSEQLAFYYFKPLKTKFKKRISMHSFRHTFATHLLKQGMSIRHVQELLGHKSLDTTAIYLQVTISDLKTEYRKFHPRELLKN